MESWQEIQNEIAKGRSELSPNGDFDGVRRAKYKNLVSLTGRPLVVYCTAFLHPIKSQVGGSWMSIDLSDKDGFNEVTQNLKGDEVDIFLHSPGGSAEATESIVKLLRGRFKFIRFIVTGTAKSAATMLAMSGNVILMDVAGEVGPIDPQVLVAGRYSPAGSIIEQFERASKELRATPSSMPVWIPILEKFSPALLVQCDNFLKLAKNLVSTWLKEYMFAGKPRAGVMAARIARSLANEKKSLSHARRIDVDELQKLGVIVERFEDQSPQLQSAIRQLHLAIMATLDNTAVVKMFENSENEGLFRMVQ